MNKMQNSISIIGCGWLGLTLGAFLAEKGCKVNGSTTRKEKFPQIEAAGIRPFRVEAGEQLEGENLGDFFQSEILIINIPPGRRRENVAEAYPREVRNILAGAEKGAVKQILFVSSTSVYADSNSIVTEEVLPKPASASGKALVEIENYLKSQQSFKVTILRMSGLVGGGRKPGRFLAGKKEVANGEAPVNLVHRDDCVQIMTKIIAQGAWNDMFNVCTDGHPTRREFYIFQAKKLGLEPPEFSEGGKLKFKEISNQKIKKALDYTFIHPDPMKF